MSDSGKNEQEYPDSAGYPDGEGTLDEGTGAFDSASEEQVDDPAVPEVEEPVPGSGSEDTDAHGSLAGTTGIGAGSGEVPD